jgi:hypothetical protein
MDLHENMSIYSKVMGREGDTLILVYVVAV